LEWAVAWSIDDRSPTPASIRGLLDWEALAVSANTLSRIPFRVRDELMIISMARWMRFIGVVQVVGGLVAGFFVLVGLIYVGASLGTDLPALGRLGRVVSENPLTFLILGITALILTVAATMLGFVLYQAADDFERVARSDEADQDYITAGIIQLGLYFKVSILLSVAAALLGIAAGLTMAVKIQIGA
jgi:hypothetical protein